MPRSVKPDHSFLREVFTWRATKYITRQGAFTAAAIAVVPLIPLFYLLGWPAALYKLWRRHRRHRGL